MMRIKDLFPDASGSGRVLVLGELLLDFVPCDSDMRLSQPGTVLKTVSGSSGIYACAAAGFGLDCSFIGKVGSDPFSQLALSSIGLAGRPDRRRRPVRFRSAGACVSRIPPLRPELYLLPRRLRRQPAAPRGADGGSPLPTRRSCTCRECCLS